MRLDWRDWVATLCVAAAVAVYGAWLIGAALTAPSEMNFVAGTVLGLGIVASAFAVVPGFERLLRGSKSYLVIASLIGLAALVAGMVALVNTSEVMLGVLVAATILLWALATTRHLRASRQALERQTAGRSGEVDDIGKAA